MKFTIHKKDSKSNARLAEFETAHGTVETPIFMPVGTAGTVKGVHQKEIEKDTQAQIILGNTYHLYLRPGLEVIESTGGCLLYTSPSPRDRTRSRMPSSA